MPEPVDPAYLATVRWLLELWAELGRPELLLPRRGGRAEPYLVRSLGQWFLDSRESAANQWAPREPWELRSVERALATLSEEAGRSADVSP